MSFQSCVTWKHYPICRLIKNPIQNLSTVCRKRINDPTLSKMMLYHHSPLNFFSSPRRWSPYSLSSPTIVFPFASDESDSKTKRPRSNSSVFYQGRNVRVKHNEDDIVFSMDLPGIKSSDAKVEILDGVLSVQAERKNGANGSTKYLQQFVLEDADVDSSKLQASLADGVLTVTVPKREEAKPVAIPVEAAYPPEKAEKDDKDIRFHVDLPGVKASAVKLELHKDTISLHAERKVLDRTQTIEKNFTIDRSKVDTSALKAYLADGLLTVTGHLKDEAKPKAIAITIGPATKAIEEGKKEDVEMSVETVTEKQ